MLIAPGSHPVRHARVACKAVLQPFLQNSGELMGQRGLIFGVASTEKAPLWLRLTARGKPGHGSMPHNDNAALRLIQALSRIGDAEREIVLRPETEATLGVLTREGMLPETLDFRNPDVLKGLAGASDLVRALVSNTISLTTVVAGHKHNVIPAKAEATVDCRLLPGQDVDAFLRDLTYVIADEKVGIEVVYRFDPLVSEIRSELLDHIEATIARNKIAALRNFGQDVSVSCHVYRRQW